VLGKFFDLGMSEAENETGVWETRRGQGKAPDSAKVLARNEGTMNDRMSENLPSYRQLRS
jgi:hypothetical protein